MKRGTIYWVNLEDAFPPEFGKTRPAVIVSNSEQNQLIPTIVIVPMSTQGSHIWPLRLELTLPNQQKSYAVIPGMRQVSKSRLEKIIGILKEEDLDSLSEAISLYLS